MSLKVELSHDSQEIELWHDDGVEKLTIMQASALTSKLNKSILDLESRGGPPAPERFMWENRELASCDACSGRKEQSDMQCGGGVGGNEMYLSDLLALRNWLNEVLDYHRKNKCKNLAKLEATT